MIVVLHYGDWNLTERCLDAVGATCDEPVTLVLNAPCPSMTGYSCDHFYPFTKNLGFAAGCNLGASEVTDELLCFLNNDTVPESGWWETLTAPFTDPQVAITGACLYRPSYAVHHRRVQVDFRLPPGAEAKEMADLGRVDAVTGACLAIRTDVFRTVHGFDEGFWNGYEDVDLCLKVRAKGWRIEATEARILHEVSAGGPERWARVRENIDRLRMKWGDG